MTDEFQPSNRSGLSERIRERLGDLSPAERKVARQLLVGPPTLGLESVARLADRAEVSGPTVSRFVSRLGFGSYREFQDALREEVSARVKGPVEVYRQHRAISADTPRRATAHSLVTSVSTTLDRMPQRDFDVATEYLCQTRHQVMSTGGWFSQMVAGYFAALLREFRPRVRAIPPMGSERAAALADLARKDIVVIFDFRRYEQDTLEFAEAVHQIGGRIVLFTDPWLSPIADIADAVLPAEVVGPYPFESLTPTLAIVESLLSTVAPALGDAGDRRFARFGGIANQWVRPWPLDIDQTPATDNNAAE